MKVITRKPPELMAKAATATLGEACTFDGISNQSGRFSGPASSIQVCVEANAKIAGQFLRR